MNNIEDSNIKYIHKTYLVNNNIKHLLKCAISDIIQDIELLNTSPKWPHDADLNDDDYLKIKNLLILKKKIENTKKQITKNEIKLIYNNLFNFAKSFSDYYFEDYKILFNCGENLTN